MAFHGTRLDVNGTSDSNARRDQIAREIARPELYRPDNEGASDRSIRIIRGTKHKLSVRKKEDIVIIQVHSNSRENATITLVAPQSPG